MARTSWSSLRISFAAAPCRVAGTSNKGVRFHALAATKNLSSALLHLRQYLSFLRPNGDTGGGSERVMFPVRDTDAGLKPDMTPLTAEKHRTYVWIDVAEVAVGEED